jgi:hypothetical protein
MPDGRISQVRFEVLAFRRCAFPSATRFKRWYAYAPTAKGWLTAEYHLLRRRIPGSVPGHRADHGTPKYPESLCLIIGVTFIRETCTVSCGGHYSPVLALTDSCADPVSTKLAIVGL